jgi:hypothetical protein
MVENAPPQRGPESDTLQWRGLLERVGDDWWATLLAGVITALAVADLLPRIPW